MRKTHRVIVLILTVALAFICANTEHALAGPFASPVLERILQRGELVVGTTGTQPPLNMTTKEGKIIGLEADLAQLMAEGMGVTLRFGTMPFADLLPALEAGKVDVVMSSVTITPKRNLKVAFVGPYFITGKAFLTKSSTLAAVEKPVAVNTPGTTLAAVKGSTSQMFVEKAIPKAKLVTTETHDQALELVIQDKADAMVADYQTTILYVLRYPEKELESMAKPLTYEPVGIALPAGDPQMVNWVENMLNTLRGGGGLAELKAKWFEDDSWLDELP
jgi:polar amino acid transport system substrate-binding protein